MHSCARGRTWGSRSDTAQVVPLGQLSPVQPALVGGLRHSNVVSHSWTESYDPSKQLCGGDDGDKSSSQGTHIHTVSPPPHRRLTSGSSSASTQSWNEAWHGLLGPQLEVIGALLGTQTALGAHRNSTAQCQGRWPRCVPRSSLLSSYRHHPHPHQSSPVPSVPGGRHWSSSNLKSHVNPVPQLASKHGFSGRHSAGAAASVAMQVNPKGQVRASHAVPVCAAALRASAAAAAATKAYDAEVGMAREGDRG